MSNSSGSATKDVRQDYNMGGAYSCLVRKLHDSPQAGLMAVAIAAIIISSLPSRAMAQQGDLCGSPSNVCAIDGAGLNSMVFSNVRLASTGSGDIEFYNATYNNATTGYGLYMNERGALEVNYQNLDNTNPQTPCQFNFFGGPEFSCVGGASLGWLTTAYVQIYNGSGIPNRRTWANYDDGIGDLVLSLQTDAQDSATPWLTVSTNAGNQPDHVTFGEPIAYTPACPSSWTGSPPNDIASALDRIAAALTAIGRSP